MLSGLIGDTKLALRRLWASPVFATFSIASLAIGLGVSTSVYSIISSLLWRPPGIQDVTRVYLVEALTSSGDARWQGVMSMDDFEALQQDLSGLGTVAASEDFYQSLITEHLSEMAHGEAVTDQYFSVVGVSALFGRTLLPHDASTGAAVVVLSQDYWQTKLAEDPLVIGRSVKIGERYFEVVGVAPRSFRGLSPYVGARTDV